MSENPTVFFRVGSVPEQKLRLDPEEISHLKALRVFAEDKVVQLKDGRGSVSTYQIPAGKKEGDLVQTARIEPSKQTFQLASAVPKGNRLEWLIQKGTELGITHFIFLVFGHSDRKEVNPDRLLRVAAEACSQSHRDFLPEIIGPIQFIKFVESFSKPSKELLLLNPEGKISANPELLQGRTVIVGPEGGFRKEELELCNVKNIPNVNAGSSILRIETAGLYAASLFRLGQLEE
ncbi:16S rRNA methyltransferase [Leptospira perolatii]|uniref:Ribosomal RNA small subunit methyltransferase E n=1 Tax=Leptospira perolatii TaxID=2023191 RepID=A0A2M9ZMK1_9LEPT|nr:RsmE family RNA methyltransferase [Leptospira perolatii]PJZ70107.1 16S rRNA methyltransferase [Leptospira perolatii]PJZ73296.1 16S rRNA methyltransferase [Leptospira perolatii]